MFGCTFTGACVVSGDLYVGQWPIDMTPREARRELHACNCVGPQNGQPRCPCQMRDLIQRDDRWVQRERIVGDVVTTHIPAPKPHGCVCPVGAEKTCAGPMCPRMPIGSAA